MLVRIEVETKMGECLFAIPECVDMQMYFALVRFYLEDWHFIPHRCPCLFTFFMILDGHLTTKYVSYFRDENDLIAALTGEEDDSSDDDDISIGSDFERPPVRQRSNSGSFIERRLEGMEPVGREPNEGRNRTEREPLEARDKTEAWHPQEVQSASEGGDKVTASVGDQPEQNKDNTTAQIVPVSPVRSQGGPYSNAYRMWRKDAFRWSKRAQLTALPHWVYRQYDTFDLARRAAGEY